jgi:hypothetical protein
MQHFYNTHIFKSSIESCRDEGIRCDVEVDYVDNVPCIDLVSSLVSRQFHILRIFLLQSNYTPATVSVNIEHIFANFKGFIFDTRYYQGYAN